MLYPYSGARRREHFGPDGTGSHSSTTYGFDESNTKTYQFNSLGFRGEEFDPDAPVKLFVSGCSNTFGVGVEVEESWAFLFKQKLAEQHDLPASSVNLMNFSQGGASNDYVTRTLLEQSAQARPDVIIAGFTHMRRFELFEETTAFHIGAIKLEELERADGRYAELKKRAEFLILGSDEIQQKIQTIKNMLLLQYFCRSRDIPFVFFFFEQWLREELPAALSIPPTQPLYEQIDFSSFVPIERAMRVDRAADGLHPGPRTQESLAAAAWATFRARYG
jgi:hypothetical protein